MNNITFFYIFFYCFIKSNSRVNHFLNYILGLHDYTSNYILKNEIISLSRLEVLVCIIFLCLMFLLKASLNDISDMSGLWRSRHNKWKNLLMHFDLNGKKWKTIFQGVPLLKFSLIIFVLCTMMSAWKEIPKNCLWYLIWWNAAACIFYYEKKLRKIKET